MVMAKLASEVSESLDFDREGDIVRVFTDDVDIYIDKEKIEILRVPLEDNELTGSYEFSDDLDFIRVLGASVSLVFKVEPSTILDVLLLKKSPTWREYAQTVAFVLDLETEIRDMGLYVEEVGEFTEKDGQLCLETVDLMSYSFEPEPGQSFKEGLLSLMSTVLPMEEFLEVLIEEFLSGDLEEEEEPVEEPDLEESEESPAEEEPEFTEPAEEAPVAEEA